MITTITTTTVTTIAAMGLTAAVSIAAIAILIVFLTAKELAGANRLGSSLRIGRIARFVNIGILPLAMAFAVIVAVKIIEIAA